MRTFIQYDGDGQIIAVVQTESLPPGLEQPFYLKDEGHGAAEVTQDSAAGGHDAIELCQGFRFDVAQRRLVKRPDGPTAA